MAEVSKEELRQAVEDYITANPDILANFVQAWFITHPVKGGSDATPSMVGQVVSSYVEANFRGRDGLDGTDGTDGTPGPRGPEGPVGPAGKDGLDGKAASKGDPGPQGIQGPAGRDGIDGTDGVDGSNGAPGIQGPAGKDGTNGLDGDRGPAGRDGVDGRDGIDGANGIQGIQGPAGKDGTNGTNGSQGIQGPGPTTQQIADAVSTYFTSNPQVKMTDYTATTDSSGIATYTISGFTSILAVIVHASVASGSVLVIGAENVAQRTLTTIKVSCLQSKGTLLLTASAFEPATAGKNMKITVIGK